MVYIRRFYDLPDGRMSAVHFGPSQEVIETTAPKIVFSHANGFNALTYRRILEALPLHTMALDLRGHGMSELPVPTAHTNYNIFRDDLIYFIDHYITEDILLSGHSFGGSTSILACEVLASRSSHPVTSLVTLDPPTLPEFMTFFMRWEGFIQYGMRRLPPARKSLNRRRVFPSREAMLKRYKQKKVLSRFVPQILEDYIDGGTRIHDGGIELTCPPEFESRNFMAQNHNIFRAANALPDFRKNIQVMRGGASTPSSRWKLRRMMGRKNIKPEWHFNHFFPMEEPDYVTQLYQAELLRAGLI